MDRFTAQSPDDDDFDEREREASLSAPAPSANLFHIPTYQDAVDRRRQEEEGFAFKLFRTGGYARVRFVSLADRASLSALPNRLQQRMIEIVQKDRPAGKGGDELMSAKEFFKAAENNLELADLFCMAGFIQPRLVLRPEDRDPNDPYSWPVEALHKDERIAFVRLMDDEGAAEKLLPFPRQPRPDVLDQRTLEAAPAPERAYEAGRGGA